MNFNQLAAAAAAAGSQSNINMNSLTTAVTNILANSNIDLNQLANFTGTLGGQQSLSAALSAAANIQHPPPTSMQSSRHNLPQAHHHRNSSNSSVASLNSSAHLTGSMSNLASEAAIANLLANPSNLAQSALADLAASAAHQPSSVRSSSSSLQSAHHRSSSSSNQHHHLNHHSSATLTAAHQQSSNAAKALAAHQSHNISMTHPRHSNSSHNSSYNNVSSNNVSKNNLNNSANLNNSFNALNNLSHNYLNSNNTNNINHNLNPATASIASVLSSVAATSTPNSNQPAIIATNSINTVNPPKNSTCYRIGDCVYYEATPSSPSQIGKIDEICKISGDNIEVKVVSFFKRRDISSSLMNLADKYQYDDVQDEEIKQMSEKDKATLRQRELFYSRQIETIPATAIRGKCTVQLLNESESLASYISKDDHYFYTLVYDPQQKTITADRGEIRVGSRYQAEVQPNPIYTPQTEGDPSDTRDLNEMETLVYTPEHNLTDDEINKFLTIAKSVGTFARALDCSSSIKQPSLHLTAASASRDVTLLYAMQLLHQNDYDLGKACCALVPSTGPVLCRDEIEEWTAGEATLFEEAIEKYGREFNEIRQDFLPWKSVKNIVEYYYMWKTTDRSIHQRRMKAQEAENKVTVLYISDQENKSLNNLGRASSTDRGEGAKKTPTGGSSNNSGSAVAAASSTVKEETTVENTNATLKRRQVTEQLPKHSTPGENLRFIATQKFKKTRAELITRKQWRHMSRRPWERRNRAILPKQAS